MKSYSKILNVLLISSFSVFMIGIFSLLIPGFGNFIKGESDLSIWLQGVYLYNIVFGLVILLIILFRANNKK